MILFKIFGLILICILKINCQKDLVFSRVRVASLSIPNFQTFDIELVDNENWGYLVSLQGQVVSINLTVKNKPQLVYQELISDSSINDITTTLDKKYLILAASEKGLFFIDISKKVTNKFQFYQYQKQNFEAQGLIIYNNDILMVAKQGGFEILNINQIKNNIVQSLGETIVEESSSFSRLSLSYDNKFLFIPCVAGEGHGYFIYDISDFSNIRMASKGLDLDEYGINRIVSHPTQKIIFIMNQWNAIISVNYQSLYHGQYPQNNLAQLGTWEDPFYSQKYDMKLTIDGYNLIVSTKGHGIYIIQVSNPASMLLYQNIVEDGLSNQIKLGIDSKYLYFQNVQQIIIFSKTTPNYNKDIPNLYTQYQSTFWQNDGIEEYPWSIEVTNNDQNLWVSYGKDGFRLYDISSAPKISLLKTFDNTTFDALQQGNNAISLIQQWKKNSNILLVGINYQRIVTVDFTDWQNPIILASVEHNEEANHFLQIRGGDVLVIAAGYNGIIMYDITDVINIFFLNIIKNQGKNAVGACADINGNVLVAAFRDYGIIIFDISNIQNPVKLSYLFTAGGEQPYFLKSNYNIIILASNLMGISIIDVKRCSWEGIEVTLTNIKDHQNIQTIASINVIGEYATKAAVSTNDQQFVFVATNKGIRVIPISTPLKINTEIFIYDSVSTSYTQITTQRGLYVGEQVKIYFSVIGNPLFQQIKKTFIFLEGSLAPLPSWITFDQNQKRINMDVDKQGIGNIMLITKNIVQLDQYSSFKNIPEEYREQIYKELVDQGYVDKSSYVTDKFEIELTISFQDHTLNEYQGEVSEILANTVYLLPSQFRIYESLQFLPNQTKPIVSLSDQLLITFKVESNILDGQFCTGIMQGVILSISQDFTIATLQGNTQSVNQQISTLKFSRKKDISLINVSITIDDYQNNLLEKYYPMSNLSFIVQNQLVQKGKSLQDQFNELYPNGIVELTNQFQFKYSIDSFNDDDNPNLEYKLYTYDPDDQQQFATLSVLSWVQYAPEERTLRGIPDIDVYGNTYTIFINATDKYSWAMDSFEIHTSSIPISYIINWCLNFLPPIFTALGIYFFRQYIYHVVCKRKYIYGKICLKVDQSIDILTPLIREEYDYAMDIIENFFEFNKTQKIDFHMEYCKQLNQFDEEKFFSQIQSMGYVVQKVDGQSYDLLNKEDPIRKIILGQCYSKIINEYDPLHKQIFQKLKIKAQNKNFTSTLNKHSFVEKDWFLYYATILEQSIQDNKLFPQIKTNYSLFLDNIQEIYLNLKQNKNIIGEGPNINKEKSSKYLVQSISQQQNGNLENENPNKSFLNINLSKALYEKVVQETGEEIHDTIKIITQKCPKINLDLLIKNLEYDMLGVSKRESGVNSHGISIYQESQDIMAVKALRLQLPYFNCLLSIYSYLKFDQKDLEMGGNRILPPWLDCEVKKNIIHFQGRPQKFDIGVVIIQIINNDSYIMKEFQIEVTKNDEEENYNQQPQSEIEFYEKEECQQISSDKYEKEFPQSQQISRQSTIRNKGNKTNIQNDNNSPSKQNLNFIGSDEKRNEKQIQVSSFQSQQIKSSRVKFSEKQQKQFSQQSSISDSPSKQLLKNDIRQNKNVQSFGLAQQINLKNIKLTQSENIDTGNNQI